MRNRRRSCCCCLFIFCWANLSSLRTPEWFHIPSAHQRQLSIHVQRRLLLIILFSFHDHLRRVNTCRNNRTCFRTTVWRSETGCPHRHRARIHRSLPTPAMYQMLNTPCVTHLHNTKQSNNTNNQTCNQKNTAGTNVAVQSRTC